MPLVLLLEALFEGRHDLVPRAERRDLGHLLRGQVELGDLAQPFLGDLGAPGVDDRLDALEYLAEHLIEAVEQSLVLHVATAAEVIELLDRPVDHVRPQRLEQRQMLLERRRDLGGPKFGEEVEEHGWSDLCVWTLAAQRWIVTMN